MSPIKLLTLAVSLPLVLAGCASSSAIDAAKVADTIGEIEPSRNDSCGTLKQIASQSSRIRTIKMGREIVVKAPDCKTG